VVSKTRMDLDETWNIAMATFDLYHKDLPYEGCIILLPFRGKIYIKKHFEDMNWLLQT